MQKIELDSATRRNRLVKKGVRFPEWFKDNADYQEWAKAITAGLKDICNKKGYSSTTQAFKDVDVLLLHMERISLPEYERMFVNRQLKKIEQAGYKISHDDLKAFMKPAPMQIIYSDFKLMRIYSDYIIDRKYFVYANNFKRSDFKEVDCGWY